MIFDEVDLKIWLLFQTNMGLIYSSSEFFFFLFLIKRYWCRPRDITVHSMLIAVKIENQIIIFSQLWIIHLQITNKTR